MHADAMLFCSIQMVSSIFHLINQCSSLKVKKNMPAKHAGSLLISLQNSDIYYYILCNTDAIPKNSNLKQDYSSLKMCEIVVIYCI